MATGLKFDPPKTKKSSTKRKPKAN